MRRRSVALAPSFVMVVGGLAGCGGGASSVSDPVVIVPPSPDAGDATPAAAAESEGSNAEHHRSPPPEPEPDSDGDGIADLDDACPNEAGTTADGCPKPVVVITTHNPPPPMVITFEPGTAVLSEASRPILETAADVMTDHPEIRVRIEAHARPATPKPLDATISLARAEAVKAALVKQGIAADRLVAAGMGHDCPVVAPTQPGQERNERASLVLIRDGADGVSDSGCAKHKASQP